MKNIRYTVLSGVIFLALVFSISTGASQSDSQKMDDRLNDIVDDVQPYEGSIGPSSALYGLKIAFENFGEGLTFNSSRKIEIQEEHARLRLAEAKAEINKNNIKETNRVIEQYREKIKDMEGSVSGFTGNATQILREQKSIIKHQIILKRLIELQPDNIGLGGALNNSQKLEEKFEFRTKVKFEREIEDGQRVRIREIEIEKREIKIEIFGNAARVDVRVKFLSSSKDRDVIAQEVLKKIRLSKDDINNLIEIQTVAPTATPGATSPAVTGTPTATPAVTGTPGPARTPVVTGTPEAAEDRLRVRVDAGKDVSEVEVELRFGLNTADRNQIVEGVFQKVSALKIDDISRVEIEIRDRREDRQEVRGREAEGEVRGREAEGEARGQEAEAGRGGGSGGGSGDGGSGGSGNGGGK